MKIYCPKCQAGIEADQETNLQFCPQCAHEFTLNQETAPAMVGRTSQSAAPAAAKPRSAGPVLALATILAATAGYLTGYIPPGIDLTIALIGILAAIVLQLSTR